VIALNFEGEGVESEDRGLKDVMVRGLRMFNRKTE
jgi:hypothetical protein